MTTQADLLDAAVQQIADAIKELVQHPERMAKLNPPEQRLVESLRLAVGEYEMLRAIEYATQGIFICSRCRRPRYENQLSTCGSTGLLVCDACDHAMRNNAEGWGGRDT